MKRSKILLFLALSLVLSTPADYSVVYGVGGAFL